MIARTRYRIERICFFYFIRALKKKVAAAGVITSSTVFVFLFFLSNFYYHPFLSSTPRFSASRDTGADLGKQPLLYRAASAPIVIKNIFKTKKLSKSSAAVAFVR